MLIIMKILNVGLVGSGGTSEIHSKNLLKLSNINIVAICDTNTEKATALVEKLRLTNIKIYDNFDEMLENHTLDVVYICIPPFAHNGQVERAANAGMHIFIEKPIALNLVRAQSMVEAVKKASVLSQVGYHMRYGTAVKKLMKMIHDGTAGVATLFDGRYDCNHLHSEWWRDKSKSGGQVIEQVIHLYDMAMYFLGAPEAVSAHISNMCHNNVEGYTVEDTSASVIRFKTGALATIAASNCAIPMEWNNKFVVIFKNVTVIFETPNKAEFIYTNSEEVTREYFEESVDMYFEEDKDFIEAVRGNDNNCCEISQGYISLCLVNGVIESSNAGGQPIKI